MYELSTHKLYIIYKQTVQLPILCNAVGGTTLSLAGPSGHLILIAGLHAVCTVALHHKHRQS